MMVIVRNIRVAINLGCGNVCGVPNVNWIASMEESVYLADQLLQMLPHI